MGFGYEEDVPPAPMIAAVVWLLREGVRRGWWRSAELAGGHRDVKATLGPGRFAQRLIPEINERGHRWCGQDGGPRVDCSAPPHSGP